MRSDFDVHVACFEANRYRNQTEVHLIELRRHKTLQFYVCTDESIEQSRSKSLEGVRMGVGTQKKKRT